jgi:hypothetical protein
MAASYLTTVKLLRLLKLEIQLSFGFQALSSRTRSSELITAEIILEGRLGSLLSNYLLRRLLIFYPQNYTKTVGFFTESTFLEQLE